LNSITPDSAETRKLLDEAQRGVPGAFDQLFARHRPAILRAIRLRIDPQLRGRVDDSDIAQEAQLEAFRRLDEYLARRPMPFGLWLRRTAHERLQKARRRHLRAAGRSARREISLPDRSSLQLIRGLIAPGELPHQRMAARELADAVGRGLARLSELDREILYMRIFDGLTHEEIALVLAIEPAAARKRYGRALLRLRAQVISEFPDQDSS
jgi:RNA polymerase sigma-70 factor (ECF subfamily)